MRNSGGGKSLAREERLQIMLSQEELEAVDTFRFLHRMPSRAAAVRELLRHGITNVGAVMENAGVASGAYSVLTAAKGVGSERKSKS
jgi:metal-responsive CopG/Arc/MetJ family transcriptional regulator